MRRRQTAKRQVVLPALYRSVLRLTRRRGSHTLGRWNARWFSQGQHIRLPTGCDFFVPPDPHFFGYITGHEPHVTRVIAGLVEPGDTCIDVGANIGYFSLMMAGKCGPTGRVVAYEPERANFGMLRINAELAHRQGLRVDAVEAAVSDRSGVVEVLKGPESTYHQVRAAEPGAAGPDVVRSVSLAGELVDRKIDGPIKLLKIDVEGHEPAVLTGCLDCLRQGRVHTAIIEINAGEHARQVADILSRTTATAQCWLDGTWQATPVAEVPHRTDILVRFA
jgi:FkbM family methyltransferase